MVVIKFTYFLCVSFTSPKGKKSRIAFQTLCLGIPILQCSRWWKWLSSNYLFIRSRLKKIQVIIIQNWRERIFAQFVHDIPSDVFLSVEVTLWPIQGGNTKWEWQVVTVGNFCWSLVCFEDLFFLSLTEVRRHQSLSPGRQLCLFPQNKIKTHSRI